MSIITTPSQAIEIDDLSVTQRNTIKNSLALTDFPYLPDRTYIVFDATTGNNNLHIITGGSESYSINKGDGSQPTDYTDTGGTKVLNYTVGGRYMITIDGDFNGLEVTATQEKYIEIIAGSNYPVSIVSNAFDSCVELKNVSFSHVTTINSEAFLACSELRFASFIAATSVEDDSFDGSDNLILLITAIGDAESQVKGHLNLYGNDVLPVEKTGINHLFNIKLFDNSVYEGYSNASIFKDDTIEDSLGNSFTTKIKGSKYIPYLSRFKVEVDGTVAIVNIDNLTSLLAVGAFINTFGSSGTGDGQFGFPLDIFVTDINIYVVDSTRDDVQIFDLNGVFVSKFGSTGTGDGQFTVPQGIAVTDTNIYVTDGSNDTVQIFDLDGVFVSKFGSGGTGDGQFDGAYGIKVTDTNIYVVDGTNNRVQIFDLAGIFVSKFGSTGTGDGQFTAPKDIAVTDTNIYVTDRNNNRVQIFDLAGTFVSEFGSSGSGDGEFASPYGISVTDTNISVVDRGNNRVQIFDLNGVFVSEFGTVGTLDGEFTSPYGLAETDTDIYVVDTGNDRVQIFK